MNYCLNCNTPRAESYEFCPHCGQAYKEVRLNFWKVLRDFFTNIFALDHQLWRTLLWLQVPGKLALNYVAGKRKSQISPGRLFFIALVLHIATLSLLLKVVEDEAAHPGKELIRKAGQLELAESYDTLAPPYLKDSVALKSLKTELFGPPRDTTVNSVGDIALLGTLMRQYDVTEQDLATLDPAFILDKYNIESRWERLLIRQAIRVNTDIFGTIKSVIANFFWLIAVMVFLTALLLKVLYIRHAIYLSEHLILSAYTHAWQLLSTSLLWIGLVTYRYTTDDLRSLGAALSEGNLQSFYLIYAAVIGLYALFAMKAYYQQGWINTILKWLLTSIAYVLAAIFVFLLILAITLALF